MVFIRRLLKFFLLIVLIIVVTVGVYITRAIYYGEDYPEPKFTVYGDKAILDQMMINIESGVMTPPYTYSKTQTVFDRGNKQFSFENKVVSFYTIYFSYGDQVGSLTFENLYRGDNINRINSIYVIKKDNQVYLEYYPLIGEDRAGRKVSGLSKSINDYFAEHDIPKEQQQGYIKKFYSFYDANQYFTRQPLSQNIIDSFKDLPLELKMKQGICPEDLRKMDLPEGEKQKLVKYAESLEWSDHYLQF